VDVSARVPRPPLPLVLLAGIPVVWLAHLAGGYTLISLHCLHGWLPGHVLGFSAVKLVLLLLTLAVGGYLATTVAVLWRRPHGSAEAARFTAFVGTLLAANVGAYLVWSAVPIFFTETCR
jgi:hypothetical protein